VRCRRLRQRGLPAGSGAAEDSRKPAAGQRLAQPGPHRTASSAHAVTTATKQSPGWQVAQPTPGTTAWTTHSGRTHATTATGYDG
jgi:hypothetical protein